MKWKILHIIIAVSLMVTGCTDSADEHSDNEKSRQEHELRLTMGMPQLQNATRALPTGFSAYTYNAKAPIDQIVGFFVPQGSSTSYYTCHFIYEKESNVWRTKAYLQDGGYFFYGYMPNVSASSVTVVPTRENNVQTGATITLNGLNAAMPDDISVIEGVKSYQTGSSLPDMSYGIGTFDYTAGDHSPDNFYVLASHIYAGLEINMKLDATYANLRKIKLRSISLTPYVKKGETYKVAEKINATITITLGGVPESDPKTAVSVAFTTSSETTTSSPAVLYGVEGKELTTTGEEFLACLCPNLSSTTKYVMETHYDVYDKEDNLIRENQSAQNTLTTLPQLTRGTKHVVNITVNPTYLYVLSDPDLDNPTFKISSSSDP